MNGLRGWTSSIRKRPVYPQFSDQLTSHSHHECIKASQDDRNPPDKKQYRIKRRRSRRFSWHCIGFLDQPANKECRGENGRSDEPSLQCQRDRIRKTGSSQGEVKLVAATRANQGEQQDKIDCQRNPNQLGVTSGTRLLLAVAHFNPKLDLQEF